MQGKPKRIAALLTAILLISIVGVLTEVGVLDPHRAFDYPVERFSAEWSDRIHHEENVEARQIPEAELAGMSDVAVIRSAAKFPFLVGFSAFDSVELGFDVAKSTSNAVAELERRYLEAPGKFRWLLKNEIWRAECTQALDLRDDMTEGKGLDNAMATLSLRQFAAALEKKAENLQKS